MSRQVLILFAHPALEKSRVNRRLGEAVRALDGVTFNDLYQLYPDLDIDVEREQQLLLEHDVVVMQHPFFWYSTPAILKEWQDLVLQHGWAYGSQGTALRGKTLLTATTAGGSEGAYFRRHDEAAVLELAGMRDDRKAYIIRAREIIRGVEQQIRDEVDQGRQPELDAAWDTTSLIEDFGSERE